MKYLILISVLFLLSLPGFSEVLDDCVCGQVNHQNINSRVINGTEAHPHKYPWMAFIQLNFYFTWLPLCGGTIISDRTILTATHCHNIPSEMRNYRILIGVHTINDPVESQIYTPIDFLIHPSYIYRDEYDTYDMSILIVDRAIEFSPFVKPICLPMDYDDELFWNHKVIAAGWGKTEKRVDVKVLMETELLVLPSEICKSKYTKIGFKYDDKAMMCAYEESTRTCQGDSGGPLFANYEDNYHIILGVTSFGLSCDEEFPEVYAKVPDPATIKWINSVIEEFGGNICSIPRRDDE